MVISRLLASLIVCLSFAWLGVTAYGQPTSESSVPELLESFVPVTDEMLRSPDPDNWISFRNGYELWGYSSLDQVNADNVDQLRLVWARAMQHGYQEVEPIVYEGVMFLANVEDIVQALDATTGDLLWEYRRNLPDNIANVTGTRYRYRNVSIYDDKIFLATNDAFLVALDARSGQLVWETVKADYTQGFMQFGGPIVANGVVVSGINGCQRYKDETCFITGHDPDTGAELWRTSTIALPGDPNSASWGDVPPHLRAGGDMWIPGAYDPRNDLVYIGTAQAKPWAT